MGGRQEGTRYYGDCASNEVSGIEQKQRLRLIIAAVFLASLVFFYGFNDGTVWWFWIWPLMLAVFVYNFLLWGERCPACKREFALEALESDTFRTTWHCRYCDHRLRRLNMRPNP